MFKTQTISPEKSISKEKLPIFWLEHNFWLKTSERIIEKPGESFLVIPSMFTFYRLLSYVAYVDGSRVSDY